MNLPMKEKQTHRHKIQTCGCQEARGVREPWMDWGIWVSRCKLLHRVDKQQGPTTQHRELYLIINHNYKKNVYIYE